MKVWPVFGRQGRHCLPWRDSVFDAIAKIPGSPMWFEVGSEDHNHSMFPSEASELDS